MHCCPSTSTCFRYESSIVGSYFSTKMPCTNWTVSADLPTPPEPRTTILYSRMAVRLLGELLLLVEACCGCFKGPNVDGRGRGVRERRSRPQRSNSRQSRCQR